jgi:N-acylneuraminate cytidylyltransferase
VIEKTKTIVIIGARSGSKSIKDKNIQPLLGKPLMAWIIEAARKSKLVNRVLVTTDSQKYAEIAKSFGAEAPFLRPAEISQDTSPDIEYLIHALKWLEENENYIPDIVFKTSACAPLFRSEYFDRCVRILIENPELDSVRPISLSPKHPYKMWKIKDGLIEPFLPKEFTGFDEPFHQPRQTLPRVYIDTTVFALRYNTIMKMNSLLGKKVGYFEVPVEDAIDINSEIDLKLAEIVLKERIS